jgi:hypothetical protein
MLDSTASKVSATAGGLVTCGGLGTFLYGFHSKTWRGTGFLFFGVGLFWLLATIFRWWPAPPARQRDSRDRAGPG